MDLNNLEAEDQITGPNPRFGCGQQSGDGGWVAVDGCRSLPDQRCGLPAASPPSAVAFTASLSWEKPSRQTLARPLCDI